MEEIKQGYKQTDIGVIPEDWEVKSLDKLANVIDPHPSHRAPLELTNGIPFLGIGDFNENGDIIKDTYRIVSESIFAEHSLRYNLNDELLGLGRVASIGKVIRFKNNIGKFTISPTMGVLKPTVAKRDYLFHILKSEYTTQYFAKIMSGSTRSSVGMIVLRKVLIPIPKNETEQIAIATALSDTDALIAALDKKIAKKQQIKQGAMQQLLTGKKRLPGFSGEWVEKFIGDSLSIKHGRDQKQIECSNGKYPILGTGGIIGFTNTPLYSKESVLIGRKGTIDKPYFYDTPFWTVDTLFYSEINTGYDAKFLFYIFNIIDWYLYNEASGVPSLNAKVIESIKIQIPLNKSEQTAIAQILTDMDNEIAQLEKERDKYKELKAGMMQVLLTGKVRLV